MKWQDKETKVFARGTVPDGYFGDRRDVEFALYGKRIVTVADCGCFDSGLPDVIDIPEAVYMIQTHPRAREYRLTA